MQLKWLCFGYICQIRTMSSQIDMKSLEIHRITRSVHSSPVKSAIFTCRLRNSHNTRNNGRGESQSTKALNVAPEPCNINTSSHYYICHNLKALTVRFTILQLCLLLTNCKFVSPYCLLPQNQWILVEINQQTLQTNTIVGEVASLHYNDLTAELVPKNHANYNNNRRYRNYNNNNSNKSYMYQCWQWSLPQCWPQNLQKMVELCVGTLLKWARQKCLKLLFSHGDRE